MTRSQWVLVMSALLGTVACGGSGDGSQGPEAATATLLTRAERTDYRETTRYVEVVELLQALAGRSSSIHLTQYGYSLEGRALPLAVVGAEDASPEAVLATGKVRVYVQGNIHGGEVCGKEALLMLLRSVVEEGKPAWSDSLVLLAAPIYNPDGNERVGLNHRPGQHGPVGGMGLRRNAQDLDLNRDHMKLEAPETRSWVSLLERYDPHLVVDLHTTNGTHHGYHLTYAPPLNPNTAPAVVETLRRDWLPALTARLQESDWHTYYYGNLPPPGSDRPRGWYTFDHRPRFNNNYVGLRNRLAILSEAYAYLPFEERVAVTRRFVEEILAWVHAEAPSIRRLIQEADEASIVGQDLAVRSTFQESSSPVEILLGEVEPELHPWTGEVMLRRGSRVWRKTLPELGTFVATATERAPTLYAIPPTLPHVAALLRAHGVKLEVLDQAQVRTVERFIITGSDHEEREFEGHRQRALQGHYEEKELTLAVGSYLVPVHQPLGRLVFTLLEPRSDDGIVNWNFLDESLAETPEEGMSHEVFYPILRVLEGDG